MSSKNKAAAGVTAGLALIAAAIIRLHNASFPVLQPQGVIGHKERTLILIALGLCALVVIPVYIMLFSFAWKYRESNKKARYEPNFDHSRLFESLWWGVPFMIITILAIITWRSSHDLDPFRPLASSEPALNVQVVSLEWKWLFIYPDQGVATVNYLPLPVNTPVNFQITSDAPMNSFWIPQLGGQVYAMSGMSTQLHLLAGRAGRYYGSSANISGDGFAGMHFSANAMDKPGFDNWLSQARASGGNLNPSSYTGLARASLNNPPRTFGSVSEGLYSSIVNKFITPPNFTPVEAL